jgi:hypothetical protein
MMCLAEQCLVDQYEAELNQSAAPTHDDEPDAAVRSGCCSWCTYLADRKTHYTCKQNSAWWIILKYRYLCTLELLFYRVVLRQKTFTAAEPSDDENEPRTHIPEAGEGELVIPFSNKPNYGRARVGISPKVAAFLRLTSSGIGNLRSSPHKFASTARRRAT